MGWPKKNEIFRLYLERKNKTYLLVLVNERRPDGYYDGIGELLLYPDPNNPQVCFTSVSDQHIYRHCRRVAWNDMPPVWQGALLKHLSETPDKYPGLWRSLNRSNVMEFIGLNEFLDKRIETLALNRSR